MSLMQIRPPVPADMPAEYRALMERCCSFEPLERPSFLVSPARFSFGVSHKLAPVQHKPLANPRTRHHPLVERRWAPERMQRHSYGALNAPPHSHKRCLGPARGAY